MIGAIIGDIVGSIYEFNNHRSKDFELFKGECFFTDDTVMTIAIAMALYKSLTEHNGFKNLEKYAVEYMKEYGRMYPNLSYGMKFSEWLLSNKSTPYNSFGNGSAMRVSAIGYFASDIKTAKFLSEKVTKVTHNHPEGIKGAKALCVAMEQTKQEKSKEEIKEYIDTNYYKVDFKIDEIREKYEFDETCQGTMPYAFACFYESIDFEDAIRNAVSIGGDSDTIACIVGALAECYYGFPKELAKKAYTYLDKQLYDDMVSFYLDVLDYCK